MILHFIVTTEEGIFETTKSVLALIGERVLKKQPYENSEMLIEVRYMTDEEEIEWVKNNKRDAEYFNPEIREIIVCQYLKEGG